MRCYHEASLYEQNCFITLTYNDDNLPDIGSLDYEAFQKFMKRLRKRYTGKKIRFYMAGEYGDEKDRPHYHACLFNHDFEDKVYFRTTKAGSKIYTSKILDRLWPYGFNTIGEVTFESAAYVARYIMKKVQGNPQHANYQTIDKETGEVLYRDKEFTHMSLKKGIGQGWYEKWKTDVFPEDIVVIKGVACKPPKYYYEKLKKENPEMFEEIAYNRSEKAREKCADNTEDRRLVKEKVLSAKLTLLKREIK